jgi:Choline/ethanolamine kinase
VKKLSFPGWPLFARVNANKGTHFLYPSIPQARFLLPLEKLSPKVRLSFFIPIRARILLHIKWLIDTLFFGESGSCLTEAEVMKEIKHQISCENLLTIVKIGTPGPHAKDTVLFLKKDHGPVAIGKFGTTEAATYLLENEAKWLALLSPKKNLKFHCPRLLISKRFSQAYVVIQSVGIGAFSGYNLSAAHIQFLSLFQDGFPAGDKYKASLIQQEMTRRFVSLKNKLTQTWVTRIQNRLDLLETELEHTSIPLVAAHRDFVPWNMRMIQGRIFVFDWEYACHGYFPLYDVFHFLLMPHILKSNVSIIQLKSILKKGKKIGELLSRGANKAKTPDFQLLAYLLDLCLMFLESRDGNDPGCPVLYRYGNLIDAFEGWSIK